MALKRLVVLVSGRGSNFAAIADACKSGEIPATVVLVLSSRADAPALKLAADRKLSATVLEAKSFPDRATYEKALEKAVVAARPDYICLAGYMLMLGSPLLVRFPGRLINIHPSLLPAFP